jgi:predicted component of type VI protein secretion system
MRARSLLTGEPEGGCGATATAPSRRLNAWLGSNKQLLCVLFLQSILYTSVNIHTNWDTYEHARAHTRTHAQSERQTRAIASWRAEAAAIARRARRIAQPPCSPKASDWKSDEGKRL